MILLLHNDIFYRIPILIQISNFNFINIRKIGSIIFWY